MTTRILVPVSNIECTYAAIESIKARQWYADPEFLLLHVVEDYKEGCSSWIEADHARNLALDEENYRATMARWLHDLSAELAKTHPNSTSIRYGNVWQRIVQVANDWGANHIMIGSHDLKATVRHALGSIAGKVAAVAPCTVEVVRYAKLRDLMQSGLSLNRQQIASVVAPPRRIMFLADQEQAYNIALDCMTRIEWPPVCAIRIVSPIPPPKTSLRRTWNRYAAAVYTKEKQLQDRIEEELKQLSLIVAEEVSWAKIETELFTCQSAPIEFAEHALDWKAQLIIAGWEEGASSQNEAILQILEQCHCSMIIARGDCQNGAVYSWCHKQESS